MHTDAEVCSQNYFNIGLEQRKSSRTSFELNLKTIIKFAQYVVFYVVFLWSHIHRSFSSLLSA